MRATGSWTYFNAIVFAAALLPAAAAAESGYQYINGTRVYTVIDRARGVATFSNDCGSQTLTQRQLQNGAIPDQIIPCPRRSSVHSREERVCIDSLRDLENAAQSGESGVIVVALLANVELFCPRVGRHDAVPRAKAIVAGMVRERERADEEKKAREEREKAREAASALPKCLQGLRAYEQGYPRFVTRVNRLTAQLSRANVVASRQQFDSLYAELYGIMEAFSDSCATAGRDQQATDWVRQVDSRNGRGYEAAVKRFHARYDAISQGKEEDPPTAAPAPPPEAAPDSARAVTPQRMNAEPACLVSDLGYSIRCTRSNDMTIEVVNTCNRAVKVQICLEYIGGATKCATSASPVEKHATWSHRDCGVTGRYWVRPRQ